VVAADALGLAHVLVTLVLNAVQAIPTDGRSDHRLQVGTRDEGEYVVLTVEDSGRGILEFDMDRLFHPPGVATTQRLGLAVARDVVHRCGGWIDVESHPGRGTLFEVYLPALRGTKPASPDPQDVEPSRVGSALVLLVDDEELVLVALGRALERFHDVVLADGGDTALALLRGGTRPDVIFCDVSMPGMSGTVFYDNLGDFPGIAERVVFVSGGGLSDREEAAVLASGRPIVRKPARLRTLLDAIEAELESRSEGPFERPLKD
jgi:CheY-like chemotaxis protein